MSPLATHTLGAYSPRIPLSVVPDPNRDTDPVAASSLKKRVSKSTWSSAPSPEKVTFPITLIDPTDGLSALPLTVPNPYSEPLTALMLRSPMIIVGAAP